MTEYHVRVTEADALTVRVTGGADGRIVAPVPRGQPFGDWHEAKDEYSPAPETIAHAVTEALGVVMEPPVCTQDSEGNLEFVFEPADPALFGRHFDAEGRVVALAPAAGEPIDAEFEVMPDVVAQAPPEDDVITRIMAAERECQDAEELMEEAKAEAKAAKDKYDNAVLRLRKLCRVARSATSPGPLFEKPEDGPPPQENDGWRQVPIQEAIGDAVSGGTIEKLQEAELTTVGKLADFCEKQGQAGHQRPLCTIKGIGEAKAEAIELALVKFHERRKQN